MELTQCLLASLGAAVLIVGLLVGTVNIFSGLFEAFDRLKRIESELSNKPDTSLLLSENHNIHISINDLKKGKKK